jgi:HEAT repeat protein
MKNPQPVTRTRWKSPRAYAVRGFGYLVMGLVSLYFGRLLMRLYGWGSSGYVIYKGLGPYGGMAILAVLLFPIGAFGLLAGLVNLVLAVRQHNIDVRGLHRAAEALDEMVSAGNVEQCIHALEDENMYVRVKAAEALGHIRDSRAVEPLIQTLEGEDGIVQRSAAKALGNIKDVRAVEPLLRALKDSDIQAEAARALGEVGDARAIGPLVHALQDRGARGISDPGALGEALARFGDQAVGSLIQTLEHGNADARRAVAQILIKIGDARAVEPLVKALRDEDGFLRKFAAQALGEIRDARAVAPLTQTLKDREDAVRIAARKALEKIRASSPTRTVCAQCGSEVKSGNKFCTTCGAKLSW